MSHYVQPKQILKKGLSSKEYHLLEEWAPQTLQGYHISESSSTESTQPEKIPNTVHNPIHRRPKNRSSSMYEEWKIEATRNEMANEAISPAVKESGGYQPIGNVSSAPDGPAAASSDNVGGCTENMQDGVVAPALHGHRRPLGQNAQSKATSSKFDFYLIAIPPT